LRLKLSIFKCNNVADYSRGRRFRFAVVDLDRAKDYPINFVCMLPLTIVQDGNGHSVFSRALGNKSLEVAKKLLVEALEAEADFEVKGEIERRLKVLEPKPLCKKPCVSCGKFFLAEVKRGFKQKFCPICLNKKFGCRQ
jgi:hypothetical protein